MTFDWYSLVALVLAGGAFFFFDAAARARRRSDGGERGDYWARIVWGLGIVLGPTLLVSGILKLIPVVWKSGWHLFLDLTDAFGLGQDLRYLIALSLPFAYWIFLMVVGLARRSGGREAGRWLAGAVGFGTSRFWVLVFAAPLALILFFNHDDLNRGPKGYPGATWATQAVLLLSLVGVARSAGRGRPAKRSGAGGERSGTANGNRQPWPEVMADHGIRIEPVKVWPPSPSPRAVQGASARDLAERLTNAGAAGIAPEMVEAIDGLLAPAPTEKLERLTRLVFAPDNCGQVEGVGMASTLLRQRYQATTLVVTAAGAAELACRLEPWAGDGAVQTLSAGGDRPGEAQLWVVDAETLSDRLLPQLTESSLVNRIGLVVWWQLESYTGVLAANLWAISRRLHRLIRHKGRHDVRILAFMRSASHGSAQLGKFVRRLLPYPFPNDTVIHIERRFLRPVHLYHLIGHQGLPSGGEATGIHPTLAAAMISTEAHWPTHLEVPDEVAGADEFLQRTALGGKLGEKLIPEAVSAEVRLRSVEPGEILSLLEILSQGGRTVNAGSSGSGTGSTGSCGDPHHVGLTTTENPYVSYLLRHLANGSAGNGLHASRRLVCAEAHSSIFRRHLLLALNEQPDTRTGLLKNFLWNEEVIRKTLEKISHEGKLTKREVRFLDNSDRLVIDYEYTSQSLPAGDRRPLDTVGAELVEVRVLGGGEEETAGVKLRVDPERLTIQAYPHRVFVIDGRRYRIREWSSPEDVIRRGWIECDQEDVHCLTWRVRNNFVFDFEPFGKPAGIGRRGRLLTRLTVDLQYEEEVVGAVNITPDLATGKSPELETLRTHALTQSFATRALILRFPEPEEPIALSSLCQALRHVVPVHLGVEEDALEVVALHGEEIDGMETYGVAVVDLYPGGIGLIDAIRDDNTLVLQLLEWTRDWLEGCPCQSDPGCEACLRSPAALAANSDQPPRRSTALGLLGQIV